MSEGIAEVIAAHKYEFLPLVCGCGVVCGADEDELTYAAHVAEELAKAGYGKLPAGGVEDEYDFGDPRPTFVPGVFVRAMSQAHAPLQSGAAKASEDEVGA